MEVYLVRQRSVSEHEYDVAFTFLLASSLLAILLVEATADRLAGWVQVDGFEPIMRVLIYALIFQATATPATARLERELDYRRVAAIELTGQVCSISLLSRSPSRATADGRLSRAGSCRWERVGSCFNLRDDIFQD